MMKQFYFIFVIFLLLSCGKPLADFTIQQDNSKVPAVATLTALAVDADQIMWEVPGLGEPASKQLYTDPVVMHRFLQSGKHTIKLTVNKGKKSKTMTKEIIFDAPEKCLVQISTPHGEMLAELYEETPLHRDNFIKLAEDNYYDGTLFHRVINGFMIQGGDPDSKGAAGNARLGSGGPGYQVDAEFDERLAHIKGALAAARTGGPSNPEKRSSGSQFYIVHGKEVTEEALDRNETMKGISYTADTKKAYLENGGTPFLDNDYTVFGRVIEGLDIIDKIAKVNTDQSDRPVENVEMKITVVK